MTMSVWEQRTSQLRRHRQMSSREILFNNPSEDKDGPPAASQAHVRPLSLHRKAMQQTLSGSVKHLTDPLASPAKNQASGSSISVDVPLDAALSGDIPESVEQESVDPTDVPLTDSVYMNIPDPPESEPISQSRNLDVSQSHKHVSERRSPRLNGERQHRAVKKFRPPDNGEALTPDIGGHGGNRGRKELHQCDHQSRTRGQGSSPANGSQLGSCSVIGEKKRNPGKVEEKADPENKEGEVSKHEESR